MSEIHGLKKHYKMTGDVVESQAVASGKGVENATSGKSGSHRGIGYSETKIPAVNSQGLKD